MAQPFKDGGKIEEHFAVRESKDGQPGALEESLAPEIFFHLLFMD